MQTAETETADAVKDEQATGTAAQATSKSDAAVDDPKTVTEQDIRKRLEEERQQLEKEKRDLQLSYLRLDTKQLLKENGLPEILADHIMASDFAQTKATVAEIRVAFDQAVQKQVEARLAGTTPRGGSGAYHSMDNIAEQVKRSLA